MPTQSPVAAATWRTDRSLAVTVMAGAAWRIGLRTGDHVTTLTVRDPDLADCLGRVHRLALSGRTVSLEVCCDRHLWKVVLSPDRAVDGTVGGVLGAAWHTPAVPEPVEGTETVDVETIDTVTFRTPGRDGVVLPVQRTGPALRIGPTPGTSTERGGPDRPGCEVPARSVDGLDLVLSRLPVPLLKVSAAGVVVRLNPAAADLFGCRSVEELTGHALSRLTRGALPRGDDGEPGRVRFTRPDGGEFLAYCTRIPWPEEGVRELVVLHDEVDASAADTEQVADTRPTLNPTEATILELTAQGLTSTQIATRLHFSVNNVEYHLGNLRLRMGGVNRVALVARAYAWGLLRRGAWPPEAVQPPGKPDDSRPAKQRG
ncbi:transcriptional regulator, LuxR family [Actinobacteria bacterium OK074]|nr:transcriptional regulator, LuxR family [Actinobacteria bacterium OK074]